MQSMNEQKQPSLFRKIVVPLIVFPRPAGAAEADRREMKKKNKQDYYIKTKDSQVK